LSIRPVLPWPHKLLAEKSQDIPTFDDHAQRLLKELCQDMADTVEAAGGRGLSAIQIGARWRVVYVSKLVAGEPLFLVNPVMLSHGELQQHLVEGCMSVPTVEVDIWRWASVRVEACTVRGDVFQVPAGGLLAHALQHELNHLDGKTIVECSHRSKRWFYKEKLKPFGGARGMLLDYGGTASVC
jgi:peptide deformylase